MAILCAALGCNNRSDKESCKAKAISFHSFPLNNNKILKVWLHKMKREGFMPTRNSRLCSEHFEEEDFVYQNFTNKRMIKKTAVPTKFCFIVKTETSSPTCELALGVTETESYQLIQQACHSKEASTQTNEDLLQLLLEEVHTLKSEISLLKNNLKSAELTPDNLDDHSMISLTGYSLNQFNAIHLFLCDIEKQKLFLFFVRLKTGMTESIMGVLFKKSQSSISRIVTSVAELIYSKIASVKIWPTKDMVLKNMPHIFKSNFSQCRVIVDSIEFVIQKPSDPQEHQLTFCNCKNANTVKCLIGISPSGAISFISEGWGGSVSDKELFIKCGILDILEPGDMILANRDFTIKAEVEAKGCKVLTPQFLNDKIQLNITEQKENEKISWHRVQVERAICRIRQLKFFNNQIPYNSLHSISKLIYIAAFFCNFGDSFIKCE